MERYIYLIELNLIWILEELLLCSMYWSLNVSIVVFIAVIWIASVFNDQTWDPRPKEEEE